MNRFSFVSFFLLLTFFSGSWRKSVYSNKESSSGNLGTTSYERLNDYVNPFIGTGPEHQAYTYPGAVLPFGMVSVSPHNNLSKPPGYIHGESHIYGFGHVHLSGTGCPDLGNVVLMPCTGDLKPDREQFKSSYSDEKASAGYYKVHLDKYKVTAEMTSTLRTGSSRYTFPKSSSAKIIIDVAQSLSPVRDAYVKLNSSSEAEGWVKAGGFCGKKNVHTVYFVVQLSKKAKSTGTWNKNILSDSLQTQGDNIGAWFNFETTEKEAVEVKVGVSYVSINNARLNLEQEQKDLNFSKVKEAAEEAWEKELSKIKVSGGTGKQKTIFYSALYHMLLHPNIFSDVNGEYVSMDKREVLKANGYNRYTVYSLWDTYRTVHPFFSLVYPDRQLDMVKSMLGIYKESGWLPKWELAGNETDIMVGDPAIPVITDTYLRGITQFDTALAWQAMKKSTYTISDDNKLRPGITKYMEYGYIPQDDKGGWVWGPVSTTQEYNVADWCMAQYAKVTGRTKDYKQLMKRSSYWKNYFDPKTRFIRAKNKDGNFIQDFDPLSQNDPEFNWPGSGGQGYVEGDAWHYNFFVPHDVEGLTALLGGKDAYINRLQKCFDEGHYILWNEPDMNYPYLFDYFPGEGWRTQKEVRVQLEKYFNDGPEGIPGNDDCGTISGFYVFSAMGFYPGCPASNTYQLSSPIFDKVEISLDPKYYKGAKFTIEAKNNHPENIYIQSSTLNDIEFNSQQISHQEIVNGAKLVFNLGPSPKK
jgi:predicted alpha-1,2-mannosidase